MHHHHDTHDRYLVPPLAAPRFSVAQIEHWDGAAGLVFASDTAFTEPIDRSCTSQLPVDARAFAGSVRAVKRALHVTAVAR